MSIVIKTTNISLFIQLLTGLVGLDGFRYQVSPKHQILKEILYLETLVQFIELAIYIWFHYNYDLDTMATLRYYDWFLTTPTMLLSTIAFLEYQENKQTFTLGTMINSNQDLIKKVVISNFCMLLFGYLGEIGKIDRMHATILGFIPFLIMFRLLYQRYGNSRIIQFMFIVWGLYGIAYMLPDVPKNVSYNFLDIIAKNFWGLYIYFKIKQQKI
jgi:hypothetical protein